jgi:fatty acid desaturase
MENLSEPFIVGTPSRDSQLIQSGCIWNKEKAEMDSNKYKTEMKYWCIHGKLYDLTDFIKLHPGGSHWLELTRGMDITEAYETHHLNEEKVNNILKQYYIKDVAYDGRFKWEENSFFKVLKKRVREKVGSNTFASLKTKLYSYIILLIYIFSFLASSYYKSYFFALIAGMLIFALIGIGHNFFHQRNPGLFQYFFDISLFSSKDWIITHVLSHHFFPNTTLDFEISSFEPYIYFLTRKPSNSYLVYLYGHIVFVLSGYLAQISMFMEYIKGNRKLYMENILPYLFFLQQFIIVGDFYTTLKLNFVMHGIGNYMLMMITFPNHRTDEHWFDGDPNGSREYGRFIVQSSKDHSVNFPLFLSMLFLGTFNVHIIHHLFPTIDAEKLIMLRPTMEETCKEFDVSYKSDDYFRILWRTIINLVRDKSVSNKKIN